MLGAGSEPPRWFSKLPSTSSVTMEVRHAVSRDSLTRDGARHYDKRFMSEQLAKPDHSVRERAVRNLKEIEVALKSANDVAALEIIQLAIKELQGDLDLRDRSVALGRIAGDGVRRAATALGSSVQATSEAASTAARSGAASVAKGASTAKDVTLDKVGNVARRTKSGAKDIAERAVGGARTAMDATRDKFGDAAHRTGSGAMAAFAVSYGSLMGAAGNLDWNSIDPTKFLDVGTRGVDRSLEQAQLVWESIPPQLRALGPEEISKWLDGFDWSHILPVSKGGGNEASNGIFELASLNRSRGAQQMTAQEIQAAKQVLEGQAFEAALFETASQAFVTAVASAAVECVLASLEYGLEYQLGNIERPEMYRRVGQSVLKAAAVGAAISGLMTIMALAFPALIPLATTLMIPLAVLGFWGVGGRIVRVGKGWYELLKIVCTDQFPEVFPATALPQPEVFAS